MPIPVFTGLPPNPQFGDIVAKVNTLVGELQNLLLNLDSLNVVHLTAQNVDTGTLNANLVTIRSDLTGTAYVQLDGNGIRANDGTRNTFEIDNTGAATLRQVTLRNDLTGGAYVNIDDTGIVINDGTQNTFVADTDGNVSLTGTVTATAGSIGGWVIGTNTLEDTSGQVGLTSEVTAGNDVRFWAGGITPTTAPYRVHEDGTVVVTQLGDDAVTVAFRGLFTLQIDSQMDFSLGTVTGLVTDSVPDHTHNFSNLRTYLFGHFDGTNWVIDGADNFASAGGHMHTVEV